MELVNEIVEARNFWEAWMSVWRNNLVDTTTASISHNRLVGSVEICRTKDLLEKVFLVEWYFHDVVFAFLSVRSDASFLQIPTHDGHPCFWLCNSRY